MRSNLTIAFIASVIGLALGCSTACAQGRPADPPSARQEFRGIFVSTAYNLDWPLRDHNQADNGPQRNDIKAVVALAKTLKCNVVILQVRSFGDRIHKFAKVKEPWSPSLNKGKDPRYDPLQEWIKECHQNGLELHAWINPFRVDAPDYTNIDDDPYDDGHHFWYRPHLQTVQDYTDAVIDDFLGYDGTLLRVRDNDGGGVDGVLFDHYIPPPPDGKPTTLPITRAAAKAKAFDFTLDFVQRVSAKVRARPGVKFGLSPGVDQGTTVGPWLQDRLCHYIIPEFYADTSSVYDLLQDWSQYLPPSNPAVPPPIIVAGLAGVEKRSEKGDVLRAPGTVSNQLKESRRWYHEKQKTGGQSLYALSALRKGGRDTISEMMGNAYAEPALVPACVESPASILPPGRPAATRKGNQLWFSPDAADARAPWLWEVWFYAGGQWQLELHPGKKDHVPIPAGVTEAGVRVVDHFSRESEVGRI
jgi:hypothetical protein